MRLALLGRASRIVLLGPQYGGQESPGRVLADLDADAEDVRALAAAGELPPVGDPVAALDWLGGPHLP
ncbi:hypothetical protein ABZ519_28055 [Streptomyces collinus]|uniref:hypothetical protein n=1 Tax=Streptomyces TaxID=1883 RepID=UPI0033DE08CC